MGSVSWIEESATERQLECREAFTGSTRPLHVYRHACSGLDKPPWVRDSLRRSMEMETPAPILTYRGFVGMQCCLTENPASCASQAHKPRCCFRHIRCCSVTCYLSTRCRCCCCCWKACFWRTLPRLQLAMVGQPEPHNPHPPLPWLRQAWLGWGAIQSKVPAFSPEAIRGPRHVQLILLCGRLSWH